jgi:hypothetical protein
LDGRIELDEWTWTRGEGRQGDKGRGDKGRGDKEKVIDGV